MTPHQIALFVAAHWVAMVSPGPAVVATMQRAFARGRAATLPYALGLAFGASLWCIFALAGLTVLFHLVPALFYGLKIVGAAYLLWLAWRIWRGAGDALPPAAPGTALRRGFLGGVALNLSNPKPALFFSAVVLSIFPGALTGGQQAAIYALALANELAFYTLLTLVLSLPRVRGVYLAAKRRIDRVTAVALGALGLGLAASR
ncbi:MAG: LysE family translocator [Rhodobacteraceae bacterium]|nr:LysE family translocator [Paracoccaceae bacterium]